MNGGRIRVEQGTMNDERMRAAAIGLVLSLLVLSCVLPEPSRNPVVWSIDGPRSLTVGASGEYLCIASDPRGEQLYYTWSCSRGILSDEHGVKVSWQAPGSTGVDTLTVYARNDHDYRSDPMKALVTVTE